MFNKQLSLRWGIILLLPFTLACNKAKDDSSEGSADFSSFGNGSLQVSFISPASGPAPSTAVQVKIAVEPLNQLQTLRLLVNNEEVRMYNRLPFEFELDPSLYTGDIRLKAESRDLNGATNYAEVILSRGGSGNPGGGSPPPPASTRTSGTFDPNCMNNNNFDACLFWKNPVAHKGSAFSSLFRMGQDASAVQTFGVKLKNQTNPNSLSNNSIRVLASTGGNATPQGGHWRTPYQTDTGNVTAQLMAYFWLTLQESEMLQRAGQFFSRNKNVRVYAYSDQVPNNAYWDGGNQMIVMGYVRSGSQPAHEMAMSSEIYLHEMGHANLQYAVGGYQAISPPSSLEYCTNNCFCRTAAGCIGGINEGQADFHFLMLFHDSPPMGETWANNPNGLSGRNVTRNLNMTAQQAFNNFNGEVHDMGAFYAAVLWTIYTTPGVNKVEFEKIFMEHLTMLTGSATFKTARDRLLDSDKLIFPPNGKYQAIITNAFAQRGVSGP